MENLSVDVIIILKWIKKLGYRYGLDSVFGIQFSVLVSFCFDQVNNISDSVKRGKYCAAGRLLASERKQCSTELLLLLLLLQTTRLSYEEFQIYSRDILRFIFGFSLFLK
jgi:hypothetical protein